MDRRGVQQASLNPANGQSFGSYADNGAEAAGAGHCGGSQGVYAKDLALRSDAADNGLSHLADAYAARLGEVIETLCLENGKTRLEATFEASLIIRALRFAAGLATHTFGRASDTIPGRQTIVLRQAVGVAGLIIPWNSPAYLGTRALAPALAAGCTAVIEVPAQAAHSAHLAAEIMANVYGGVFDRFPKATLVLGHMGETLPFILWRLDSRYKMLQHTNNIKLLLSEYIQRNIMVTTAGSFSEGRCCARSTLLERTAYVLC